MLVMKKGDDVYLFPAKERDMRVSEGYTLVTYANIPCNTMGVYKNGRKVSNFISYQESLIKDLEDKITRHKEMIEMFKQIEKRGKKNECNGF